MTGKKGTPMKRHNKRDDFHGKDEKLPNIGKLATALRGMKDIVPDDQKYWRFLRSAFQELMDASYVEYIETPPLESEDLYDMTIGDITDHPELALATLTFGDEKVILRPEHTSSVMRAYFEHSLYLLPQPVKLWYQGHIYHYEQGKQGRFRQQFELGFECLGDLHPVIDAQGIALVAAYFRKIGLPIILQVGSAGDKESRTQYGKALADFLKPHKHKFPKEVLDLAKKDPLKLFETNDEELRMILKNAPQLIDFLKGDANAHFVKVLEHLDELDVPYVLQPRVTMQFPYYTYTTFTVVPDVPELDQIVLGGGGRYQTMGKVLGSKEEVGGFGFSLHLERIVQTLKKQDRKVPSKKPPEIFLAQLGDKARKKGIAIFNQLRDAGFRVAESFSKEGLKGQMEIAARLNVGFTLIIGQKEIIDDTVLLRDMENGIQEVIDNRKIVQELQKRLRPNTNGNGNA